MISFFKLPPLLLPLCLFIFGIAAAGSLGLILPPLLLFFSSLLTLPLLLARMNTAFMALLGLSLFAAGNLMIQPLLQSDQEVRSLLEQNQRSKMTVEGIIASRPEAKDGGYKIIIRPATVQTEESLKVNMGSGLILLRTSKGGSSFASGDRISFTGKLKPPRNFGMPLEFDSERFYALKNICATSFVQSAADISLLKAGEESRFQRHFDLTAAEIGRFIMSHFPTVEGGVLKALLIGDISDIPQAIKDQYSRTGVNHILSISGFHVGIIALALFQLWSAIARLFPSLLLRINFRRFALLVSIPLITYYMFLSGAAPATSRSVIMLCLLSVSLFLERESDSVNTLSLAAFTLLLINPAYLYDISFQLSFLALWGLTALTPVLSRPFTSLYPGWTYKLILFAAASTAAVAVTLLPVAYYFQQSSLTGIISNFLIVPLLGYGAVVTGFTALPFIYLSPGIAWFLLYIAAALTKLSNVIIAALAQIPVLPLFIPTEFEIGTFLTAMLLITITRNHLAKSALIVTIPLLLITLQQLPSKERNSALRIDFFSVGQGESSLIMFADGRKMLIDGGGALYESGWDIGRQLLLPTLRKMGVKRIDYLVLTHSHPDHLQGIIAVLEALPVGEFWESGLNRGKEYRNLQELLQTKGVPVKILSSSSPMVDIAGTRIRCLHPVDAEKAGSDMNETSLTLRFETGGFSALFTGDIGFEAEAQILRQRGLIQSTLLKVPHHGSRYSTGPDFLDAVAPEIALISAGFGNSFGLPSEETINQLATKRIRTFRTDLDGTVTIKVQADARKPLITTQKGKLIDSGTNVLYF